MTHALDERRLGRLVPLLDAVRGGTDPGAPGSIPGQAALFQDVDTRKGGDCGGVVGHAPCL